MATRYVKFGPEDEAKAEAYVTFLEAGLPAALVPWPRRDDETGKLMRDVDGNFVVAWYGPPFMFGGVAATPLPGDAEAWSDQGVLVDDPEWPE